MSDAADRVQAFLDERAKMRGLDPELISAANLAELTTSDLAELVLLARTPERPSLAEVVARAQNRSDTDPTWRGDYR